MQHLQPNTTLQGGKYRIERVLGQGGFGITYLARSTVFDVNVAIKEFFLKDENERDGSMVTIPHATKTELFLGQKEKFKKEAKRMFAIKNEHVVAVHDLFEENGTAYYVMDYVDGENLSDRLKRTGRPMSEDEVSKILPQILDALKAIHDVGIWHLDLKPANILLGKEGNVKLVDFGASKQFDAQKGGATTSTMVSHTPGYAPREQMEQSYEKFGPWTDFYALGATLYNLLTNKRPPMPTDLDDDHSEDKHLALPLPPTISEKTKTLILCLMKTNRSERPVSAQKIYEFLEKELVQEPVPVQGQEPTNAESDATVIVKRYETGSLQKASHSEESVRKTDEHEDILKASRHNGGSLKKMGVIAVIALVVILGGYYLWNVTPQKDVTIKELPQGDKVFTVKGVSFTMAKVSGGTFLMGATSEQGEKAFYDEAPVHSVTLSDYYIGETEVTQALWQAVMGGNPSDFKGSKLPVESVSWDACQAFIRKLNNMTGQQFRLPTEAEWEFAARGGNTSQGYRYSGGNDIEAVAWYDSNSDNKTHEAGTKAPNELGLYDMSGNVWEWCQDWYGDYDSSGQTTPTGPSSGAYRVLRGGSWGSYAKYCRVSYRNSNNPTNSYDFYGLRLAL